MTEVKTALPQDDSGGYTGILFELVKILTTLKD
jgi:hypothetical protein